MKKVVVHLIRDEWTRWPLRRPQRWRWVAKGANGEVLASGERYTNKRDALHALGLLFGDSTEVTLREPAFPEYEGFLREPRPF